MAVMAVAAVVMAAAVAAVLDAGMAAAGMLSGEHAQGSKATVVGTARAEGREASSERNRDCLVLTLCDRMRRLQSSESVTRSMH